jgi:hypothetical protein
VRRHDDHVDVAVRRLECTEGGGAGEHNPHQVFAELVAQPVDERLQVVLRGPSRPAF